MSYERFYWIGQRLLDGAIYAQVLPNIDIIFCCDTCDLPEDWKKKMTVYSLERKLKRKLNWSSFSIDSILAQFGKKIHDCDVKGYRMFPYDIPTPSSCSRITNPIINWKVISQKMSRTIQRMILSQAGISVPRWLAVDDNTEWEQLESILGNRQVAQYDNTSSGHGTFFIQSKRQFGALKKYVGRLPDIISSYVPSIPISCHVFISNNEIIPLHPSVQIIEEEIIFDFTSPRYCGNDFNVRELLDDTQIGQCKHTQKLVGSLLSNVGIRGLVGIDMLVFGEKILVNEINFRLQNSTALYTMIEMNNKIDPIIRRLAYPKPIREYNYMHDNMLKGAQYIVRSHGNSVRRLSSGLYDQNGKMIKKGAALLSAISQGEYLIISECGKSITTITHGAEIAKIYSLDSMLAPDGKKNTILSGFLRRLTWI